MSITTPVTDYLAHGWKRPVRPIFRWKLDGETARGMALPHATAGWCGLLLAACVMLARASPAHAQAVAARHSSARDAADTLRPPLPPAATPLRTVTPGAMLGGGPLRRWLLGAGYRDLWTTRIAVHELDLDTFAGGLRATKAGGGTQTKSLRLESTDGREFTFREVQKDHSWSFPQKYERSLLAWISRDMRSTEHPAGALVAAALLDAIGVLHPTPLLAVMPEHANLGEFAAEFSGKLGLLEEYPDVPKGRTGFASADKIIDSDELLALLNADPAERVDAPAFLRARLADLLLADWDRHPGQWKWARMPGPHGLANPWEPITRDRDAAFESFEGAASRVGGFISPASRPFNGDINVHGLTDNATELDGRLLAPLTHAQWDSVTAAVMARVTDTAIAVAVRRLPAEMKASGARLVATLLERRAGLPAASQRFYAATFAYVDLHASDSADVATVVRVDDRTVTVRLASATTGTYFARTYDRDETSEIRLYLHGGDDSATVTGTVARSIPLRIIGGNGRNVVVDASTVGSRHDVTRLYNMGEVRDVAYGKDSLFNRRPLVDVLHKLKPAQRDAGGGYEPIIDYLYPRGLGFVPRLGITRYRYGFDRRPYDTRLDVQAEYAIGTGGWRLGASFDKRLEQSSWYYTAVARMSQLEVINYHGLGNTSPDSGPVSPYYNASQTQWSLSPAIALALSPSSDLSFGVLVQLSQTARTSGRFLAAQQPYGVGTFGQAGVQVILHHDLHAEGDNPSHRLMYDIVASAFPAAWDVRRPFAKLNATIVQSIPMDLPARPLLILRAGGRKTWGDTPYFEAAFIGDEQSTRYMEAQRFAGDLALFATGELRLHLVSFRFIPLDAGVLGLAEAGRVWVNGASPGGWHPVVGGGLWVGLKDSRPMWSLTFTNEQGRPGLHLRTGLGF